jgi:hypothetical protein
MEQQDLGIMDVVFLRVTNVASCLPSNKARQLTANPLGGLSAAELGR